MGGSGVKWGEFGDYWDDCFQHIAPVRTWRTGDGDKMEDEWPVHAARGIFVRSQCLLITLAASSMQEKVFV
jgi:hypothetical protein